MPRLAFRPLVLIAVLALMAVIVGAQAPMPQPEDQETARIVVELLERGHMARPVIDDQIALKWFDNYLKELDPQKLYFLKSDVQEFKTEAKELDDQIREGNIDFARKVFDRFLQRNDERFKTAMELLHQKFDFTADESITDDPDHLEYPVDKAEADARMRKKVKLDMLVAKVVEELDPAEAVRKWTIRYRDRNRMWHQVDSVELLELYLSSLTKTFDPHSSYLGPKTLEDMLNTQLHLTLEGIGASLRSEDGYAVVQEVVPGMAADKDGRLQPEDKIIGIQKENGEEIDLVEKKLTDVVRYIRGPRGTKVRLIVQPEGTKERRIYELTREKIELKEQHARGKVVPGKGTDGRDLKIGIISLPAFYGDTRRSSGATPMPSARRPTAAGSSATSSSSTSTPWWSTCGATAAACSKKPRPSPACSSTPARSFRSRSSLASSHSPTTRKERPGMGPWRSSSTRPAPVPRRSSPA